MLLLNNQHLGMVVQWEDRFYGSNRGHTYLGAGDDQAPYPDFVTIAKGFGVRRREHHATRTTSTPPWTRCSTATGRSCSNVHGAVPGARAADDPRRHDGAGHHQGVSGPPGRLSLVNGRQSVGFFRNTRHLVETPMRLVCPTCATQFSVEDELAGRPAKCPNCGAMVPVSQPAVPQSTRPTRPTDTPQSSRDRAEESSNQERTRRQERGDSEQPHTTNRGVGVVLALAVLLFLICCGGVTYGVYWALTQAKQ